MAGHAKLKWLHSGVRPTVQRGGIRGWRRDGEREQAQQAAAVLRSGHTAAPCWCRFSLSTARVASFYNAVKHAL